MPLETTEIPQSNHLGRIRRVVEEITRGALTSAMIADAVGLARRQVNYALNAARILGFAETGADGWLTTSLGRQLANTPPMTPLERDVFARAILASPQLSHFCKDLLSKEPPSLEELTARIRHVADLSKETATRRAQTLLAWRSQIFPSKEQLPLMLDHGEFPLEDQTLGIELAFPMVASSRVIDLAQLNFAKVDLATISQRLSKQLQITRERSATPHYLMILHARELTRSAHIIATCGLQKDIHKRLGEGVLSFNKAWLN